MNYTQEAEKWEREAKRSEQMAKTFGAANMQLIALSHILKSDEYEKQAQHYRQLAKENGQ